MRKIGLAGGLSAALLVAGCSAAPDTGKVAEDVTAAMTGAIAAINARDAEKAVAIDSTDYVGAFHGTENVKGKAGDLARDLCLYLHRPQGQGADHRAWQLGRRVPAAT